MGLTTKEKSICAIVESTTTIDPNSITCTKRQLCRVLAAIKEKGVERKKFINTENNIKILSDTYGYRVFKEAKHF